MIKNKNDIALIRFSRSIDFTDAMSPACLQIDLRDEHPDRKLIVSGWGSTSSESKWMNICVKHFVRMNYHRFLCVFEWIKERYDQMICLKHKLKHWDSLNAMQRWYLIIHYGIWPPFEMALAKANTVHMIHKEETTAAPVIVGDRCSISLKRTQYWITQISPLSLALFHMDSIVLQHCLVFTPESLIISNGLSPLYGQFHDDFKFRFK